MLLAVPCDFERDVFPPPNDRVLLLPQLQRAMRSPKLGSAVREVAQNLAAYRGRTLSLRQRKQRSKIAGALIVVDGPPVIRVDQAELPELVALIKVGNSRDRTFQRNLCQGIH